MKCPKCGYTSFESYDSCRKCSVDLTEFKQTYGLAPVILPPSLCASLAAELEGGSSSAGEAASDNSADMFSFDLPTEQAAAAPAAASAPAFSFDTPPEAAPAQNDPFASLLESTPQASKPAADAGGQGYELNSFSWDDTPTPGQADDASAAAAKTEDDDFNSLFGDLGSSDKK